MNEKEFDKAPKKLNKEIQKNLPKKCYNCGKEFREQYGIYKKPYGDFICMKCLQKFLSTMKDANPETYNCMTELKKLICEDEIQRFLDESMEECI